MGKGISALSCRKNHPFLFDEKCENRCNNHSTFPETPVFRRQEPPIVATVATILVGFQLAESLQLLQKMLEENSGVL